MNVIHKMPQTVKGRFRTKRSTAKWPCSNMPIGAEDEIRTRDPVLGKDVLYH